MSLIMKYFVLNPSSSDEDFAHASRVAMRAFANAIAGKDKELADELRDWADSLSPSLVDEKFGEEICPENVVWPVP